MKIIKDIIDDKERAFYASHNTVFQNIKVEGPLDGESAFKESNNIIVEDSVFDLRYPFWHNSLLAINNSVFTTNCRAALWYCNDVVINESTLNGVKVFRECNTIKLNASKVLSSEPFWFCHNILMKDSLLEGEYAFFKSENLELHNLTFKGKYSFQYAKNVKIYDSYLDTKDAFWHAEEVEVYNSVIKGEYLAWYAKKIKLVHCKIIGTQPICYTKDIELINCEMIDTDLAFEYSTIKASIKGEILSIKNPYQGIIKADSIKEVIIDENSKTDSKVEIIVNNVKIA